MSPAEPPAAGATPVPAAVGFPIAPGDPESIEFASRRLGGVADGLDVQAGTMRSTATLLADFWRGHAASAYQALSSIITEHFHVAGETSRSAATALRRYGLELERCRRKGMAATAQAERCLNEIKFQTRRLHDAQLRVSVAQDALSAARADGARARAEGPFGTARAAVADLEAIASQAALTSAQADEQAATEALGRAHEELSQWQGLGRGAWQDAQAAADDASGSLQALTIAPPPLAAPLPSAQGSGEITIDPRSGTVQTITHTKSGETIETITYTNSGGSVATITHPTPGGHGVSGQGSGETIISPGSGAPQGASGHGASGKPGSGHGTSGTGETSVG